MNRKELRRKAMKSLKIPAVQNLRRRTCNRFSGKEKRECEKAFDKSFVDSFIKSYLQARQKWNL